MEGYDSFRHVSKGDRVSQADPVSQQLSSRCAQSVKPSSGQEPPSNQPPSLAVSVGQPEGSFINLVESLNPHTQKFQALSNECVATECRAPERALEIESECILTAREFCQDLFHQLNLEKQLEQYRLQAADGAEVLARAIKDRMKGSSSVTVPDARALMKDLFALSADQTETLTQLFKGTSFVTLTHLTQVLVPAQPLGTPAPVQEGEAGYAPSKKGGDLTEELRQTVRSIVCGVQSCQANMKSIRQKYLQKYVKSMKLFQQIDTMQKGYLTPGDFVLFFAKYSFFSKEQDIQLLLERLAAKRATILNRKQFTQCFDSK